MKQKLAVFDIDGTLCNAHLGVEFLKEMASLHAIRGVSQGLFDKQYEEWSHETDRTTYYDKYFDGYYTSRLVGVERSVFDEAGRRVATNAFPNFYREVLAELNKHRESGRFILVISKSPEQAVKEIARLVRANDCWGWQFNFDASDKYVDQYVYPNGESDKVNVINRMAQKHDLLIDDAFAYGDSAGDISMLELVTNPNAVNPEPQLLSKAQRKNWRILRVSQSPTEDIHS